MMAGVYITSNDVFHFQTVVETAEENRLERCLQAVVSGALVFRVPKIEPETLCNLYHNAYVRSVWKSKPVPKIIHQSWKNVNIPEDFKKWSMSWKSKNPAWEYWFWTDEDNRELVASYYPEYLDVYNTMWVEINRADFVRSLYMHRYGGIYADLDTWCLQPIDNLVSDAKAYVAEMSEETGFNQNIPNAWLASGPGHPFWIFFSDVVIDFVTRLINDNQYVQAEQVAGPMILKQSLDAWNDIHGQDGTLGDPTVEVVKAGKIYLDDWHEFKGKNERSRFHSNCPKRMIHLKDTENQCRKTYPDAYALTFWTHSWAR